MSGHSAFVRTFKVGRFTAEVSVPRLKAGVVASAVVEWTPSVPNPDIDFTPSQRAAYGRLVSAVVIDAAAQSFK